MEKQTAVEYLIEVLRVNAVMLTEFYFTHPELNDLKK
jgi:hypothetical protein